MVEVTKATAEATDPRIHRSRQALREALMRLLAAKELDAISVQEIVNEAGLNRATFYLHYPDKTALLSALADYQFRELLAKRGISFDDGDGALKTIVLGVCDYLTEFTNCWVNGCRLPIERSIVPAIEAVFMEGMAAFFLKPGVDPALLAVTGAWAVFGAARRWSQNPEGISADAMADSIVAMVKPIFSSGLVLDADGCPAPKPADLRAGPRLDSPS